jgi:serine/threonine protein kinase
MKSDESQVIKPGSIILSRFEVRERVARGGFAVVWKAHDRLLGKDVALKVLHAGIADDPAAVEEMKRETLRSRELTHPNIVQTYDFVQDGSVVAIAMELIDGDTMATLAARRENGCFNPPDLASWMADVCDALDFAHSEKGGKKPVVHHDLKPSNFIVDRYGTAKVLDFGIAKSVAETRYQHTGMFEVAGTPPYMSPQQLRGQRPRPSDDIYSFGATLFALLTRTPPFFRGDIQMQITNEIPPTMNARRTELGIDEPPIPLEWEETVAQCLAKDPAVRPKTMNEVAVSLGVREPTSRRMTASTEPTPRRARPGGTAAASAGADPPSTRTRPMPRRRKPARAPRVVLAVVLFAALVLWPGGSSDSPESGSLSAPAADVASTAQDVAANPATEAAATSFGPPALPAVESAARSAVAEAEEHARAEEERKLEQRRAQLEDEVSQAMMSGAWRDAATLLEELAVIAPDDPRVKKWASTVNDQLGVHDLVEAYRIAQESRDAAAYSHLWVGLPEESLETMSRAYAELRSLRMRISNLVVRIGGTTATVAFRERITFDLRNVGEQTTDARTVLTLQKTADGWKIAARETEQ